MTYLIGVDVGTQSVRSCLFDLDGAVVASASRPLTTTFPRPTWAEQDPEEWWRAAVETLKEILQNVSSVNPKEIAALSYDCTACTVVALTEDGRPIRPALLWMDERAYEEADEVSATGHEILKYCGGKVSPQWMLAKGRWIERHEPDVFRRARWIVDEADFFTFRLTGRMTASLDNATAKWNYARPLGGLARRLSAGGQGRAAGDKWPTDVLPVGRSLGRIQEAVAREVGLSPETMVAQGGIDAHAGEIALGAVGAGDLALIMGSSTCHMAQSKVPVFANIWGPYPDALVEGMYTLEGGQTATGSIIQWLVEHFGAEAVSQAKSRGQDVYAYLDGLAEAVPPGSEGLLVLDYFQGNRTPYKDPLARGTVIGLTLKHCAAAPLPCGGTKGSASGRGRFWRTWRPTGSNWSGSMPEAAGRRADCGRRSRPTSWASPIHLPARQGDHGPGRRHLGRSGGGRLQGLPGSDRAHGSHRAGGGTRLPSGREVYDTLYRQYVDLYPAVRATMHTLATQGS